MTEQDPETGSHPVTGAGDNAVIEKMTKAGHQLKARCLCLDIETARQDKLRLREIGVYRPDSGLRERIPAKAPDLVVRLNRICAGAAFVLGHNVLAFDQPALALLHPDLILHRLPIVDTLELSPIAFPQNPYHRLVKDYKLMATTRNDPVRDAELSYELFLDQRAALQQRVIDVPDEVLCLHFLLAPENGTGIANFFATLRGTLRPSLAETQAAWLRVTRDKACVQGVRQVKNHELTEPDGYKALAYVLAWLRVAGSNSVLPPWVCQTFPQTRRLIALLRDIPCNDADCRWCQEQHDLKQLLPRYFPGIHGFRDKPALADGTPLQQAIVEHGFAGQPILAILPTGGGKSLCYQLPALARYYRNGSLTVVVSPLQSLMKDQVDNLESRGITCSGFLNSLLNPLERRVVLDKIRLGDIGLIYVAPEQFRSTAFTHALTHREIGAWIYDEAHCLSKWGHDFRPDYLYVSRFIKARQKDRPSPVCCFTATAKPDVVNDIIEHFANRLGMSLTPLMGGVSRDNLRYEVHAVPSQAKYPQVLHLLEDALREEGGGIVFCARRKTVEEIAGFLNEAGLACGFFHGDLQPEEKRKIQEDFIGGELRVIAATNAFGMGVDKADVRLVIHLDTPGSLENYLQEAGRAGRDQLPARCVLLYDETDMDIQFRLLRNSKLSQNDIYVILKALRSIERKDRSEGTVVVTSGEILLEIPDRHGIDPDAADADTKVRIAVAWLEEARLLQRMENHTRVFPGSLRVASLEDAADLLRKNLDGGGDVQPYLDVLSCLFNAGDAESISTDELMMATGKDSHQVQQLLRDLDRLKLLSSDNEIGVTLYRDPNTADRLANLALLEKNLLALLREEAPDADLESWQIVNVRRLCDALRRDSGVDLTPDRLSRLLKSYAEPFGSDCGQRSLMALRPGGQEYRMVKLQWEWAKIENIGHKRVRLGQALVNYFLQLRQGNQLLVTCKQGELETAVQNDVSLQDLNIKDWQIALASTLLYLDTNEVFHLARGKALFRPAMTIQLNAEARRRQFKKSDYAELALHYKDKIVQIHVMAEYARLALDKVQAAMSFIVDYFTLERSDFIERYFAGRAEILEIATTETAHRRILTDLQNPDQQAIVAAPADGNYLVLAGPGSGKTRVIVHRVAWLLRECLVMPDEIMVLAYNRLAMIEIRRRLWALLGADAAGVRVQTLHGLAMRLTGTSFAVAIERDENVDFDAVIRTAAAQLQQTETEDESSGLYRDRMLAGLRYLLVDEYQDINADHYALISALVGRQLHSEDDKLSLMVVGDDDQNIYAFSGSNVRFIQQFNEDYQAKTFYLLENYRSTAHIVGCANRVIDRSRQRMKRQQTIRVDFARQDAPQGGEFASWDPLVRGRVHILQTPAHLYSEVPLGLAELMRLKSLGNVRQTTGWGQFAVIARNWSALEPVAAYCRQLDIPVRLLRDGYLLKLYDTREGQALLALLKGQHRRDLKKRVLIRSGALARWFKRCYGLAVDDVIEAPYRRLLAQFISECESLAPGCEKVASDMIEMMYEFGSGGLCAASGDVHAPMLLLTAHRAKGLEFDHVLIMDADGWNDDADEERRLFYVAMTRARKTLTLCAWQHGRHAFIVDTEALCLKSQPQPGDCPLQLQERLWTATPDQVVLSWPGRCASNHPLHEAIARLDYGSELHLQRRSQGGSGWEITDSRGTTVTRMAKAFVPPAGRIQSVRVGAILARQKKSGDKAMLRCDRWEVVLPEIIYLPD